MQISNFVASHRQQYLSMWSRAYMCEPSNLRHGGWASFLKQCDCELLPFVVYGLEADLGFREDVLIPRGSHIHYHYEIRSPKP